MTFTDEISFKRENSLTTLLERELERRIITGALKPGDRLNENALAGELQVSRGPIREACRKLEQAGLLTIVINRGVFVRSISTEELLEVREIHAALAQVAARKIPASITDEEIAQLGQIIAEMDVSIEADDYQGYFMLNLKFHEVLMTATRSPRLAAMYSGMDKTMSLSRRQSLATREAMRASNSEHKVIHSALSLRDEQALSWAMASHSIGSRLRLLKATEAAAPAEEVAPRKRRKRATNGAG